MRFSINVAKGFFMAHKTQCKVVATFQCIALLLLYIDIHLVSVGSVCLDCLFICNYLSMVPLNCSIMIQFNVFFVTVTLL